MRGALAPHGLDVTGGFHPGPEDGVPGAAAAGTLLMVGATGGGLWAAFSAAPEHGDGAPDPLDRWSRRVLSAVAEALGAEALFPFGGPPWLPFMRWAARAEGATASPVAMAVTPARGLYASWRGALGLRTRLDLPALPPPGPPPCATCAAPCTRACPVDAFADGTYDVARCRAHLDRPEGAPCREAGCLARRACPANVALPAAQAAFHLEAFRRAGRPA
ncbi:MAG: ferredoxin [Pseudomonadota bacterium]